MERDDSFRLDQAGKAKYNRTKPLQAIPKTREQRLRAARRLPQAVVKVASYASGHNRVRATVKYVAREGGLLMEDEGGLTLTSWEEIEEVLKSWKQDYGQQGKVNKNKKGRDAMHLVLSAPKGADKGAVQRAIRDFAAAQFGVNHQYLFTLHDDTAHPHGHLVVNARGFDGKYLRSNKAVLHAWRDLFAEKCREHGIEVDASSRLSRGIGTRGRSLKLLKTEESLRRNGKALRQVDSEVGSGGQRPWEERAKAITELERRAIKTLAQALFKETGGEASPKILIEYANSLPEPASRRELQLELVTSQAKGCDHTEEKDRD